MLSSAPRARPCSSACLVAPEHPPRGQIGRAALAPIRETSRHLFAQDDGSRSAGLRPPGDRLSTWENPRSEVGNWARSSEVTRGASPVRGASGCAADVGQVLDVETLRGGGSLRSGSPAALGWSCQLVPSSVGGSSGSWGACVGRSGTTATALTPRCARCPAAPSLASSLRVAVGVSWSLQIARRAAMRPARSSGLSARHSAGVIVTGRTVAPRPKG